MPELGARVVTGDAAVLVSQQSLSVFLRDTCRPKATTKRMFQVMHPYGCIPRVSGANPARHRNTLNEVPGDHVGPPILDRTSQSCMAGFVKLIKQRDVLRLAINPIANIKMPLA